MGRAEIPEPWATAMIQKGFVDASGHPMIRPLADAAGIHQASMGRVIKGEGKAYPRNVIKIARALGGSQEEVTSWIEKTTPHGEAQTYTPPPAAHLLKASQRKALDRFINEFHRSNQREARLRGISEVEVSFDD